MSCDCLLFWPAVAGMPGLCALGITSARMGQQLLCLFGRGVWRGVSTGELQQQTFSTAVFIGACIFLVCRCMAAWSRKRCVRAAWTSAAAESLLRGTVTTSISAVPAASFRVWRVQPAPASCNATPLSVHACPAPASCTVPALCPQAGPLRCLGCGCCSQHLPPALCPQWGPLTSLHACTARLQALLHDVPPLYCPELVSACLCHE